MENVQPGRGNVSVANGVREAIAEIGDLGPLKGAQARADVGGERAKRCIGEPTAAGGCELLQVDAVARATVIAIDSAPEQRRAKRREVLVREADDR